MATQVKDVMSSQWIRFKSDHSDNSDEMQPMFIYMNIIRMRKFLPMYQRSSIGSSGHLKSMCHINSGKYRARFAKHIMVLMRESMKRKKVPYWIIYDVWISFK